MEDTKDGYLYFIFMIYYYTILAITFFKSAPGYSRSLINGKYIFFSGVKAVFFLMINH